MRRALLLILCVAGMLVGCGDTSTVKPEGAERSVVNVVSRETGFHPTDVKCPSGVEAAVGGAFECEFTGPEGPYVAHMRILKVEGEKVVFRVRTLPRSP